MSESATQAKPSGPGQLLQSTRTELGLSTREISEELRLSPNQIRALEEEDYDSLPGSTYVRGYLKSYARLINLSEEEVLKAYDVSTAGDSDVEAVKLAVTNRVKGRDNATKGLVAVTLLVVVGLAVVWWQGRKEYDITRFELTSDSANESEPAQPEENDPANQTVASSGADRDVKSATVAKKTPATETKSEPVVPSQKPAPVVPKQEPTVSKAKISEPTPVTGNKPPVQEKVVVEAPPVVKAPDPAKVVQTKKPAEEQNLVVSSSADSKPTVETIVLFFDKGSWADVRDVNNKRLLYRAVSQGQVVELKGMPPFKLFIGNADGVRMEYRGKPYDLSEHITGVFARFVLGE